MNATTPQETLAKLKSSLRRRTIFGWAFGILTTLFGLGVALSGSLTFGSERTEGTVIKFEPEVEVVMTPDPSGTGYASAAEAFVVYYPVVEYQVSDRKYNYRSRWDSQTRKVGEKVPIVYKVNRPEVARVNSFTDRWLGPSMIGGLLVVLGVGIMVGTAVFNRVMRKIDATLMAVAQSAEQHKAS